MDPVLDTDPSQPHTWNRYGFVRSDPASNIDPDGMATRRYQQASDKLKEVAAFLRRPIPRAAREIMTGGQSDPIVDYIDTAGDLLLLGETADVVVDGGGGWEIAKAAFSDAGRLLTLGSPGAGSARARVANVARKALSRLGGAARQGGAAARRTGFRAVSDAELLDIAKTGRFRPHPGGQSMEAKWFSETREGADFFRRRYDELEHVVEVDVPVSVYQRAFKQSNIDQTGPGFAVAVDDLSQLAPKD